MEFIVSALIWAALFQGILLGVFFIFSKKHKSFSNKLLGLLLLSFVSGAASDLAPFESIGSYQLNRVFSIPEVQILLPLLFLHYVLEKIGRSGFYRIYFRINYTLAFAIVAITLVNVVVHLATGKSIHVYIQEEMISLIHAGQRNYAFVLTIAALVISILETLKYRRIAQNEYSDSTLLEIGWLWQFISVLVPVLILWGAELVRIYLGGTGTSDFTVLIWVVVAGFVYFVSFKAHAHQDLFLACTVNEAIQNKTGKQLESNAKDTKLTICEEIRKSMETEQFYLRFDLSLYDFAKEISVSPRLISRCINKTFGFNFNEWVNNYRVEKAIELLADTKNNALSLEGIGLEAGFKSRSAMYIAFQKKTGKTPGYFRKNRLS